MGNFKGGSQRSGKRDLHNKSGSGFGNYSRGAKQMHQSTCSECGNDCEIPFKPKDGRPVFCSNCFQKQDKPSFGGSNKRNHSRSNYSDKQTFEAVCETCGDKCDVPFRPSGDKPVYCRTCFGKNRNSSTKDSNQYQEDFKTLNTKLDKILDILETANPKKTIPKKDVKIVEAPKKAKKEVKAKTKKVKKTDKKVKAGKKAAKK